MNACGTQEDPSSALTRPGPQGTQSTCAVEKAKRPGGQSSQDEPSALETVPAGQALQGGLPLVGTKPAAQRSQLTGGAPSACVTEMLRTINLPREYEVATWTSPSVIPCDGGLNRQIHVIRVQPAGRLTETTKIPSTSLMTMSTGTWSLTNKKDWFLQAPA
mmetsp:Transcript_49686/g.131707  ORF Transcript_49686/g.131707 Transcript_49686/m.131707 type:complete len:161 (+) Transcript_49686:1068-1550(+)